MGLSHKLGVLFFGVNLLLPASAHALIIEPVKIDSSQGEPLYAEIPFHHASSQSPLQVSIAQPFELGLPEVLDSSKTAHYNFYVRQNNQGNGVIVITSSRPIHENTLNLVLKINDNGQVHMQQLRNRLPSRIDRLKATLHETPLQPRIVVNEADLKLNLPESSTGNEQRLTVSSAPPPMLNSAPKTPAVTVKTPAPPAVSTASNVGLSSVNTQPVQSTVSTVPLAPQPQSIAHNFPTAPVQPTAPLQTQSENLSIQISRRAVDQPPTAFAPSSFNKPVQVAPTATANPAPTISVSNATTPTQTAAKPTQATTTKAIDPNQQHRVKANESLWEISNQIAKSQNISVHKVMRDIQNNNQHAFVGGNASRLKQGVVLNIPSDYALPAAKPALAPATQQARQIPKTNKAAAPVTEPQKQNDAHMSIVANTNQGSAQGTNQTGNNNTAQQNELTIKLKQARGTTLSLQNNVRQLDQQLREKEKRIALLNARLAELQQQLKSRQTKPKVSGDVSNTTSQSQGVIPAFIAGTLVAFAGLNSNFAIATLLQELI